MIVSITNNKGGQGKTTTAINLGHALANKKKRILVVDMDSQCNTSSTLASRVTYERSLYDLLDGTSDASSCVQETDYQRLFLIPNIQDTSALEPELFSRSDHGFPILRDALREYAIQNFDHVLLDCPPNLGMFSVMAMTCSDSIIVPVEVSSRYAEDGLEKTLQALESIRTQQGIDLRLLRILLTKADMRTNITRISVANLRDRYKGIVFNTIIKGNVSVQEAEALKLSVIRHDPKASATRAYNDLAKEFLHLVEA